MPNLDSFYPRSLSLLKLESKRLLMEQTGWLHANWVHLSNWIVFAGREDKIVIALRKARALDGLEIIYFKTYITCYSGAWEFPKQKGIKEQITQITPSGLHYSTQHSYSQRQQHTDLLIPDVGSLPLNLQEDCHQPPQSWWHIAKSSQLYLAGGNGTQTHSCTRTGTYTRTTECSNFTYLESGIHSEMNQVTGPELMKV